MRSEIAVKHWSKKEAERNAEEFVHDARQLWRRLTEHWFHKAHAALGYPDDLRGFTEYASERLSLSYSTAAIRLQIAAAEVSANVGADVPIKVAEHLSRVDPEVQVRLWEELNVSGRERAGLRSGNQMGIDAMRIVGRELRPKLPPAPEPQPPAVDAKFTDEQIEEEMHDAVDKMIHKNAQEGPNPAILSDLGENAANDTTETDYVTGEQFPPERTDVEVYLQQAVCLMRKFCGAYINGEQMDGLYHDVRKWLADLG